MKIAYSGIEGAFANIAAGKIFPGEELLSFPSFEQAYRAVEKGRCDVVVLPIENSYTGEVAQVTDLMYEGSLFIHGIYPLRISQNLLGVPGSSLETIKKVISHSQALAQCADFITDHGFEPVQAGNTAVAAKQVSDLADPAVAAIASKETAKLYGLILLAPDINVRMNNTTRFAVLTRGQPDMDSAREKDSNIILAFAVRHEAGMLAEAIGVIGRHGFNMNSIRSRPMKELMWQYYFYVEIDGRYGKEALEQMLGELSDYCETLKVLGIANKQELI